MRKIKQCPTCAATVKGRFPADMHGPLQYGDGLKAFAINLLVCQMVALNRVQKLLTSMLDVMIAEETLLKFVLRLHLALETWETQAKNNSCELRRFMWMKPRCGWIRKTIGYMFIQPAKPRSSFYIESAAKRRSSRLTSFRVTVVPSSMTVGHPILPIQTANMVCAGRICCAN